MAIPRLDTLNPGDLITKEKTLQKINILFDNLYRQASQGIIVWDDVRSLTAPNIPRRTLVFAAQNTDRPSDRLYFKVDEEVYYVDVTKA